MRTIDEYMKLPYKMEIIPDTEEGGYAVSFPDLPGCLTVGDTIEEAIKNAEDAKRAWLEAAIEDGFSISEPDDLENYSGQFKLRIPKSLHKSLSEHSKAEGISMNQYCVLHKEVWHYMVCQMIILENSIEHLKLQKCFLIVIHRHQLEYLKLQQKRLGGQKRESD